MKFVCCLSTILCSALPPSSSCLSVTEAVQLFNSYSMLEGNIRCIDLFRSIAVFFCSICFQKVLLSIRELSNPPLSVKTSSYLMTDLFLLINTFLFVAFLPSKSIKGGCLLIKNLFVSVSKGRSFISLLKPCKILFNVLFRVFKFIVLFT